MAGTPRILFIMVILIAVLGLVVINALAESPWGLFTVGMSNDFSRPTFTSVLFVGLPDRH